MKDKKDINEEIKNKVDHAIDSASTSTYSSAPEIYKSYEDLSKSMDQSIDKLISRSRNKTGNNMSQLYSRLHKGTSEYGKDVSNDINDIFGDPMLMEGIMSSYMENLYIKEHDLEIDTICRYMPSLLEALEVKKDAVLSADVFNKDFMSINNISSDEDEEGRLAADMKELEKIYKLSAMIEESYMNTSLYGEQYIYIVGYKDAFETLLDVRNKGYHDGKIDTSLITNESENIVIKESMITGLSTKPINLSDTYDSKVKLDGLNMTITISESNIIHGELLQNKGFHNYINEQASNNDIIDMLINENHNFYGSDVSFRYKNDNTHILDGVSQDGLYDHNKEQSKVNVLGCVVRRLKRENVLPIYIDDVCLGYYYIENTDEDMFDRIKNASDPFSSMGNTSEVSIENMQRNEMIKRMAELISNNINAKFINTNPDISNEIYTILKHNYIYGNKYGGSNNIKITFIPPKDMVHFYFKKHPKTHRGMSDLYKSMFPAKMYTALYITNTLGILTRSQDKRAYFVKQHVDTNIAKLLMNTITQIKKSNFGVREINNINNIFNITGRFNDYIIPVSQGGERPIDFEVIQGQDIDENPELMDRLEAMAINPIGVPLELLDISVSVEFARQLTTSNGKFGRNVLKRQGFVQEFISNLITRIYNYHFDANTELESILSPPSYLTISNTNELISNATDMVNSIIDMDVPDDEKNDPWVSEYKKELMKFYLSSYIDWDEMNKMKKRAKITAELSKRDEDNN